MIHDWVVLIMWVTSLGVTAWGQVWRTKAERLKDAIQYLLEEQADEGDTEEDQGDAEEVVPEDSDTGDRV